MCSYCQLREVTDAALQQLYWACRNGTGFPGDVPYDSMGLVSTTDILKGLGLIKPDFDMFDLPKDIAQTDLAAKGSSQIRYPFQHITSHGYGEFDDSQSFASLPSTVSSTDLSTEQVTCTSSGHSMSELATPDDEIDMKEQFLTFSADNKPVQPDERIRGRSREDRAALQHAQKTLEPQHMNVDALLDMSFYTTPSTEPQSLHKNYASAPFNYSPMVSRHFSQWQPDQHAILHDGFLSPWPGSLAAAQQAVSS